jgi:SAM-dependent methyltransferase
MTSTANTLNASTFSAESARYAAARPTYPAALFDWLALQAPGRTLAWDAGCGTGQATTSLAERFAQVIANDVAPEQVAQAPRLANVTWHALPAEAVDLPVQAVDLVIVAQALHWFDLDRFYPAVQRALRPGGIFAAFGYSWFSITPAIDAQMKSLVLDPLMPYWAPGNAMLWSGYAQTPFPFAPIDAPPFAITLKWTLKQTLDYVSTWSAAKRMRAETNVDIVTAAAALAPAWGDSPRTVTMPLALRTGRRV